MSDLGSADGEDILAAAGKMDDDGIREVMNGPHRTQVLETLADHMAARLREDKAADVEAVLHVKIWDKPGGGYDHLELVIRHGKATRSPEPQHDPDLTLKASPIDFMKLVDGRGNARMMALRGKLRVQGDLRLGMKLQDLFKF